jgi:hypothetical protein
MSLSGKGMDDDGMMFERLDAQFLPLNLGFSWSAWSI